MNYTTTEYITKLTHLRNDLTIYMKGLPSGSDFNEAKKIAEEILPLIAGQIQKFENNPLPNQLPANSAKLRELLEKFHYLMTDINAKDKFSEHLQVVDSLVIHECTL